MSAVVFARQAWAPPSIDNPKSEISPDHSHASCLPQSMPYLSVELKALCYGPYALIKLSYSSDEVRNSQGRPAGTEMLFLCLRSIFDRYFPDPDFITQLPKTSIFDTRKRSGARIRSPGV